MLFNFGASGDLARQIEAGAPVVVFASAAQKDMDDLDRKEEIFYRPQTQKVARFFGVKNIFSGKITEIRPEEKVFFSKDRTNHDNFLADSMENDIL